MFEFLGEFFSTQSFMPHGHCYLWKPALLWLQVIANGAIGLAYVVIAVTLTYLVYRGQYLPFKTMALLFGAFIVSCGLTHFFDIYVIWHPAYWLDGAVRAVTAVASVGTAVLLPPLVPRAVALARGARAARERGVELETMVQELEEMYQKTRELDRLKTQFFANVSHELRTPLALIIGPVEKVLREAELTEQERHNLEVVVRNARTLHRHVDDLLDVSRLEAGRLTADYQRSTSAIWRDSRPRISTPSPTSARCGTSSKRRTRSRCRRIPRRSTESSSICSATRSSSRRTAERYG